MPESKGSCRIVKSILILLNTVANKHLKLDDVPIVSKLDRLVAIVCSATATA